MIRNAYAFIIPTKDRAECVAYYLDTQAPALADAGFDIIICDSSSNNATKNAVAEYSMKHADINIIYETYLSEMHVKYVDNKGFDICKKYCLLYEYLWLSADGGVFDVSRVFPVVKQDMISGKDLIVISNVNFLPQNDMEFTDAKELCLGLCWRMTLLGSVIASGKVFCELVRDYPYESDDAATLWLPTAYFKLIAQRPFAAGYHCVADSLSTNPYKKSSFWRASGNVLWQWGKVWCDSIDSLPPYYDSIKEAVILSHDKYARIFSLKAFPSLVFSRNLSHRKVLLYKDYIRRVTKKPYILFWMASLLPF